MSTRNYGSAVPATTLASSCTNVATSLSVTSSSGYPTAPFVAIIDKDTASEEVVLVTNVAGTTWTITRGYDGTTGLSHTSGASVQHGVSAIEFREANTHVNATSGVHGVVGSLAGTTYVDAADALKAPLASPTFTGSVVVPTPSSASNPTTKTYVDTALALKANLASPTFTGTVTVPTATASTSAVGKGQMDTAITTATAGLVSSASPTFSGTTTAPTFVFTTATGGSGGIAVLRTSGLGSSVFEIANTGTGAYVDLVGVSAVRAWTPAFQFGATSTASTMVATLNATPASSSATWAGTVNFSNTLQQGGADIYATAKVAIAKSGVASYAKNTWHTMPLDTTEYDPGNLIASNKVTVAVAGVYQVAGTVAWARGFATGGRACAIAVNGTNIVHSIVPMLDDGATETSVSCSTTVKLAIGDYVTLQGWHSDSAGISTVAASGGSRLSVVRIGA